MVKGNPNKILLVATRGMGDAVQLSGTIQHLQNEQLYLLTNSIGKETLFHNPHIIDEFVITYQSKVSLFFQLKKLRFDKIYTFHSNYPKWLNYLGTPIEQHRFEYPPHIITTDDEQEEALTFLRVAGWDQKQPILMIDPFANDHYKEWPPEYFIKAAQSFRDHYIIVHGTRENAKKVKEVARHIEGALPLIGQASLRTLISILQRTKLLLTNDSEMLYLAHSQKTPTLALFSATKPVEFCHTLAKRRACTPCLKKRCHDPFCMRQIGVNEVITKMKEILYAR